MSTTFQGSRLANLRQKKQSIIQNTTQNKQTYKPLSLADQQDSSYQPSMAVQGGRTATRFLKGRIQRTSGTQKLSQQIIQTQNNYTNKQNNLDRKPSLKLNQAPAGQLKLVLNDQPQFDKKKTAQVKTSNQQTQKRILIQKKQQKQELKPQMKQVKEQPKSVPKPQVNPVQQQVIMTKNNGQIIQQEEIQESKDLPDNQNQLVECPQGCGRKFNKKALQKHAKACKLVFMSKRKQFNSQAKRLTSQQQAALVKQNKLQQKKAQMSMTKGKGFDKTSDNWKAASQDFRSAIKAIKKQGVEQEGQQMKTMTCEYCQKPFAQVLLAKHLQNCVKKKQKQQKQKKKTTKKK